MHSTWEGSGLHLPLLPHVALRYDGTSPGCWHWKNISEFTVVLVYASTVTPLARAGGSLQSTTLAGEQESCHRVISSSCLLHLLVYIPPEYVIFHLLTAYQCTQKWQGLGSMSHLVIFHLMYTLLSYSQLEQTLCYIWRVSRHHPVCLGQPQWNHCQEQEASHRWLEGGIMTIVSFFGYGVAHFLLSNVGSKNVSWWVKIRKKEV